MQPGKFVETTFSTGKSGVAAGKPSQADTLTVSQHEFSIRQKMRRIYCLAVTLVVLIGLVLAWIPNATEYSVVRQNGLGNKAIDQTANEKIDPGFKLDARLVGFTVASVIVMTILWLYTDTKIMKPLQRIDNLTQQMTEGRLAHLIVASQKHRASPIEEALTDVAVNMQEFLLTVWNMAGCCLQRIATIEDTLEQQAVDKNQAVTTELSATAQDLKEIRAMAQTFTLYDVTFENEKVLAVIDKPHSCE
jgi:methyl-accepting chemotaxis protein